jgi:hypothetical protein
MPPFPPAAPTWDALPPRHRQRDFTDCARKHALPCRVHRAVQHSKEVGLKTFKQGATLAHQHNLQRRAAWG